LSPPDRHRAWDDRAIVIVSDRAPFAFAEHRDGPRAEAVSGSVSTILARAAVSLDGRSVDWVTVTARDADRRAERAGRFQALAAQTGYTVRPVHVTADVHRAYYAHVGVRMLWFALHELWDELPPIVYGPADRDATVGFARVSQDLAERIAAVAEPGAPVLVNDYQLLLVPGRLRAIAEPQPIALFLHTPFAGPASMERLPRDLFRNVVESMLAADLLGFQRRLWAERFLDCCRRAGAHVDAQAGLVRSGRRTTWVRCYPIAIDPGEVAGAAAGEAAGAWARELVPGRSGHLVARVDRLDPAKNVLRGFQALRLLLEREPALRAAVRFAAVLVPSRDYVPEYRWYAERVWECVEGLRRDFPGVVTVLHENDRPRAMGALRVHDVLLVNSLLDGMNVVAQEAAVVNERAGVVVLSTGAGAFELLGRHAIPIASARDVGATADALARALALPAAERRRRAEGMREVVAGRGPAGWLRAQLEDLRAVCRRGEPVSRWP
jgi:trehalose 6-phosphate synthase